MRRCVASLLYCSVWLSLVQSVFIDSTSVHACARADGMCICLCMCVSVYMCPCLCTGTYVGGGVSVYGMLVV